MVVGPRGIMPDTQHIELRMLTQQTLLHRYGQHCWAVPDVLLCTSQIGNQET